MQAIMEERLPRGPARLIHADEAAMIASCAVVRRFAEAGGSVVLCHDPQRLEVATAALGQARP
jgi:hypothetical protein